MLRHITKMRRHGHTFKVTDFSTNIPELIRYKIPVNRKETNKVQNASKQKKMELYNYLTNTLWKPRNTNALKSLKKYNLIHSELNQT